jgi:hypothetical protein
MIAIKRLITTVLIALSCVQLAHSNQEKSIFIRPTSSTDSITNKPEHSLLFILPEETQKEPLRTIVHNTQTGYAKAQTAVSNWFSSQKANVTRFGEQIKSAYARALGKIQEFSRPQVERLQQLGEKTQEQIKTGQEKTKAALQGVALTTQLVYLRAKLATLEYLKQPSFNCYQALDGKCEDTVFVNRTLKDLPFCMLVEGKLNAQRKSVISTDVYPSLYAAATKLTQALEEKIITEKEVQQKLLMQAKAICDQYLTDAQGALCFAFNNNVYIVPLKSTVILVGKNLRNDLLVSHEIILSPTKAEKYQGIILATHAVTEKYESWFLNDTIRNEILRAPAGTETQQAKQILSSMIAKTNAEGAKTGWKSIDQLFNIFFKADHRVVYMTMPH